MFIEKERIQREMTKIVLKQIEKMGEKLLLHRLLWLVRKVLSPSSLQEAKPASCTEKDREILLFAHSHLFCLRDNLTA